MGMLGRKGNYLRMRVGTGRQDQEETSGFYSQGETENRSHSYIMIGNRAKYMENQLLPISWSYLLKLYRLSATPDHRQ